MFFPRGLEGGRSCSRKGELLREAARGRDASATPRRYLAWFVDARRGAPAWRLSPGEPALGASPPAFRIRASARASQALNCSSSSRNGPPPFPALAGLTPRWPASGDPPQ